MYEQELIATIDYLEEIVETVSHYSH